MVNFHGSKLALIVEQSLLVYQRDSNPNIPYPGLWDLPGGGRENDESPEECVLRELQEEFALSLTEDRLIYRRDYYSKERSIFSCFFVACGSLVELDEIVFGKEGQHWRLMPISEFLAHDAAVPTLKLRLNDYLRNRS